MNLFEAFATIERLDARDRLLIGLLSGVEVMWAAGHVDQLDGLDGIENTSECGATLADAIAEYNDGAIECLAIVAGDIDGRPIILLLGAKSPQEVDRRVAEAHRELIRRYAH